MNIPITSNQIESIIKNLQKCNALDQMDSLLNSTKYKTTDASGSETLTNN